MMELGDSAARGPYRINAAPSAIKPLPSTKGTSFSMTTYGFHHVPLDDNFFILMRIFSVHANTVTQLSSYMRYILRTRLKRSQTIFSLVSSSDL